MNPKPSIVPDVAASSLFKGACGTDLVGEGSSSQASGALELPGPGATDGNEKPVSLTVRLIEDRNTTGKVIVLDCKDMNPTSDNSTPLHTQKHFHVRELAEMWGVSPNTARRWFENEPGVLKITIGYRRGKDHKVTLRVPESIAAKVHRERSGGV